MQGQALAALLPEGDAPAGHDSDQPHSYPAHLAPERPFTKSLTPDLSFLFCCNAITFLFLLFPAPKTPAHLLWHVCAWGKQSHSSLSGDVLYAAGQLSPPAAPAARAANLEKMHNMHIANSHSSSQCCASDTQAQPSKLLWLRALKRHILSHSWLPCNKRQKQTQGKKKKSKASGCGLWFLLQKMTSYLSLLQKGPVLQRWPIIIKL